METGEPTRIQPGHGGALVPAPEPHPAETEAHERSPTLMAGEVAGKQGQVRVWSPSRRLLWRTVAVFGMSTLLLTWAGIAFHFAGFFFYIFFSLLAGFCACIAALRRPCYITTDSAGIGITTRRGSQALCWNDIRLVRWVWFGRSNWGIELWAPDPVKINLTGYPQALLNELFAYITTRAALQQHPARRTFFMNPGLGLRLPAALMEEENEDIRSEVMAGRKREAIKRYRRRYGGRRRDAKASVDTLDLNIQLQSPEAVLQARLPDPGLRRELEDLIRQAFLEQAQKLYRRRTGAGPVQAYEVICMLEAALARSRESTPGEQ